MNIEIMRAFVRLREMLATHKESARKFEEIEERIVGHDEQIKTIFEAIRQPMAPPEKERKRIDFEVKEGLLEYGTGGEGGKRMSQA